MNRPDSQQANEAVWAKINPDAIGEDGRHPYKIRFTPETVALVHLLALRRGVSMTKAVEIAIENEVRADNAWHKRLRRWTVKKLTPSHLRR